MEIRVKFKQLVEFDDRLYALGENGEIYYFYYDPTKEKKRLTKLDYIVNKEVTNG